VQLSAFMSMNIDRHVKAHRELYEHLANGEAEKAATTKAFYDEYFAMLDLTAEFYLETLSARPSPRMTSAAVRLIFQEHALPRGRLGYRGRRVDPAAPCCSPSRASATTFANLRPYLKRHHMQVGVGHYGVFSGKRWENQIYPLLKNVILSSD
jgi:poly(3-hydroxybutyrate) depolymerase